MPASAAQIAANKANSLKSCGPRTPEGKEKSRANALRHGLTGAGVALTNEDAAEVQRRIDAFHDELRPVGEVQHALVRQAVVATVRIDRCVSEETARLIDRVDRAAADFVAPAGVSAEEAAQMKARACARAMLDSSPEGVLARKYESAARSGFLRALKELQKLQTKSDRESAKMARENEKYQKELASFLASSAKGQEMDRKC